MGIGHWALGIGHWALGIGHWALGIKIFLVPYSLCYSSRQGALVIEPFDSAQGTIA
ncbi:hypothetical protein [Microcoleus anatoxicus]|uniref:Uncharacterized protein n=1 Tax=Microcoleus anatoxicus PTRS2 TaxID=2705321 RepID=A0ABU8YRB1_9CYAN